MERSEVKLLDEGRGWKGVNLPRHTIILLLVFRGTAKGKALMRSCSPIQMKFDMLSLLLNLRNRPCLVVGTGAVGMRKAGAVREAGGQVDLIGPAEPKEPIPEGIRFLREPYRIEHLDGVFLAFAAATPEVNSRVVRDAKAKGVLVSSADDPDSGDFALPAIHRQGELILSVSTGGASPHLAAAIRDQLAPSFDESFARWLRLLKEIRPMIRDRIADPVSRRELRFELSDLRWLDRLREVGEAVLREELFALVDSRVKR